MDPSPVQGTVVSWRCKNYCGSFALWCSIAKVFSVCYIESFGDRIICYTKTLSGNAQRYQVWEAFNLYRWRWNPRNRCQRRLNLNRRPQPAQQAFPTFSRNSRGNACCSELMTCILWCKISNPPWISILCEIKCTVSVKCGNIAFNAAKDAQVEFHCWFEFAFW